MPALPQPFLDAHPDNAGTDASWHPSEGRFCVIRKDESSGAYCGERLLGGLLLGFLLRPARAGPELLAVDLGRTGEVTRVGRPVDGDHDVADAAARLRERLLELGLMIDVGRPGVLDPVGEGGDDRRRDLAVAVLEEERGDRRFEQRGGDVPALDDPGELVAGEARRPRPRASRSPICSSRATAAQL